MPSHPDRPLFATQEHDLSRAGLSGLPTDILRDTSRRLITLAAVASALAVVAIAVDVLLVPRLPGWADEMREQTRGTLDVLAGVMLVLSVALVALARSGRLSPSALLDAGLVYALAIAASIGVANYWRQPYPVYMASVSWLAVWALLFATLVPNTPRKTLLTAYAIVGMEWVGLAVAHARGMPELPQWDQRIVSGVMSLALATFAVVPAVALRRLGHKITEARRLGAYRLERRLGQGGMGEVWLARHSMLARPAAVKLIHPETLGGGESARLGLARFEREAQATALLQSPNTVRLYDYGLTDDGMLYIVMELLDGRDLHNLVKEFGPVEPERAAHLLRQVCGSLAEAHAHGLIHRDIKPANVFTCRRGLDTDVAKVLDFGLVKAREDLGHGMDGTSTADNMATGTPAFMSPEIAGGKKDVDGRTDVYSVGCVAYWLLTGSMVFDRGSPMELMIAHIQDEPPYPGDHMDGELPREFEALVMRCLAKNSAQRPTAVELESALEALVFETPWTSARSRAWWDAHLPAAEAPAPEPVAARETMILEPR